MTERPLLPTHALHRRSQPARQNRTPWGYSAQPPKLQKKVIVATESWWLDLNRVQFAQALKVRFPVVTTAPTD